VSVVQKGSWLDDERRLRKDMEEADKCAADSEEEAGAFMVRLVTRTHEKVVFIEVTVIP
jgi:hypothetical protein